MDDFDADNCVHCRRPEAEHNSHNSESYVLMFGKSCPVGEGRYWPFHRVRAHAVEQRSKFVREALVSSFRGQAVTPEQIGKVWDAFMEDEERFIREWRPK